MSVSVDTSLVLFLSVLFRGATGCMEFRALPSRHQMFIPIGNLVQVATFLAAHAPENVYVGCASRRTPTNGRRDNLHELWVLFVDVDFKDIDEGIIRALLAAFPLPPTLIIRSGHGLHLYWVLKEPFVFPGDVANVTTWLQRLALRFAGDLASAEPVRVLRVPGSWNHKDAVPQLVTLEHASERAYNISEFDEWLPPAPRPASGRATEDPFRVPPTIRAGERNLTLYRSARSMHAKGFSLKAILAALVIENESKCDPPLDRAEVEAIAAHAFEQPDRDNFHRTAPAGFDDPGVSLNDFYAYMPQHMFMFAPSRDLWPASSVNSRLPGVPLIDQHGQPVLDEDGKPKVLKPSVWLDQHRPIEQMTWRPGDPMVISDRLVSDGGWVDRPGCTTFNLYRPPIRLSGDPRLADRWVDHVQRVYPDDHRHLLAWLAHRVQRPAEKINHAIVLGGLPGVGKDTILEPMKTAVGPWNFGEVSPSQMLGRFNGFVKSVILRVSEIRDLGDIDRYGFYEHLKVYIAAPPDVLRVDEKNLREYAAFNVCGVVITTNHRTDGLYLPADDRRHYVAWSPRILDDFTPDYWSALYAWYADGGDQHVAAYLQSFDLSDFNPKAPPPKTAAFWDVVDANRAPEDAELADVLEALESPIAVTLAELASRATPSVAEWLRDRKSARQVPHRMEVLGYVSVRSETKDGLWVVDGHRQVIYVRHELTPRDRLVAAKTLSQERR